MFGTPFFKKSSQGSAPRPSDGANRREAPRYAANELRCQFGRLLDLSISGTKVLGSTKPSIKPGDIVSLTIASPKEKLTILAKTVRVTKNEHGFAVAFRFVDRSDANERAIENLARSGFVTGSEPGKGRAAQTVATPAPAAAAPAPAAPTPKPEAPKVYTVPPGVPDYYGTLGITPEADERSIAAAFRSLAMVYHPDHNKTADASMMGRLNEAYKTLSDPEKRRAYDRRLAGAA
jgi:hypothetical protein